MRLAGIDEAGYGPLLGPLVVVGVCAQAEDAEAFAAQLRERGVRDSKAVHDTTDITAIEQVALPALGWLTGKTPTTAAAAFALLGEDAAQRTLRWMRGAEALALPAGTRFPRRWQGLSAAPQGLAGAILHPHALNAEKEAGRNRAQVELHAVGGILARFAGGGALDAVVDRLGGRLYYRDALQTLWPDALVLIEREGPAESAYAIARRSGEVRVAFRVGADATWPLTALASCIAKYLRELHLILLNRHWASILPKLKPTAGYPEDARRWLGDLGDALHPAERAALVRR